jgi:hypothetical protein
VLNKIISLKQKYSKILEDYMPDILNIIREDTVQSIEINQKVLELVTDLATERNIKEVGVFLESEILKAKKMAEDKGSTEAKAAGEKGASSQGSTTTNEYRYLLIKCINRVTQ